MANQTMFEPSARPLHGFAPPSHYPPDRRYYALGHALKQKYGQRVHKISIDVGLGCPNVDLTRSDSGCIYCNIKSFTPSRRYEDEQRSTITRQIDTGAAYLEKRFGCTKFVAYFQAGTNTYAAHERLKVMFAEAVAHPKIVGLAVSTRPDCVSNAIADLLAEFADQTEVTVELGLQSVHLRSLDWIGREHDVACFPAAVARLHQRGLHAGAHVILGLPGETRGDFEATARECARVSIDSIKIHNLYVVKDTRLADVHARGELRLLERDEFIEAAIDFLEWLPPTTRVDRIGGDAPPQFLIAPMWCLAKAELRLVIDRRFAQRDTWQGAKFDG